MFPLALYNYAEIGAFLVCLFLWPRLKKTDLALLMPYLGFIVCVELVARYMGLNLDLDIGWIYNIVVPLETLFYAFLFRKHLSSVSVRRVLGYFMVGLILFALVFNIFFWQKEFYTVFLKIYSVSTIILSCLYFLDILRRDIPVNVLHQPMFWIAVGLIIFSAGELAMSLLLDQLFEDKQTWRRVYGIINNNLNVFLYLMLSIGAIVAVWKKKPA